MARSDRNRSPCRPAHHGDDHVRTYRATRALGAAFTAGAQSAGKNRRHHRVRAAAVRGDGSAAVFEGPCTARADLPRGGADARGGAPGSAYADFEYPGIVGEDGRSRRCRLSRRRRQRCGWHIDERIDHARRRRRSRSGIAAGKNGCADSCLRAQSVAAHHALWRARCRTSGSVVLRSRACRHRQYTGATLRARQRRPEAQAGTPCRSDHCSGMKRMNDLAIKRDQIRLHPSWLRVLGDEFDKPYMVQLKAFLQAEKQAGKVIYPPAANWFNALNTTPFDQVKVVVLGQDPYHGPGQAHGLCFSVLPGVPSPPSLVNMFKELHTDLGIPVSRHGNLQHWAEQGVLLLNSVLTVEQAKAGSHQGRGWETFTDACIAHLNREREGLV